MGKPKLPVALTDNAMVVVRCDRLTREIEVITEEKSSYSLGNYWRASLNALPYLRMAFGGDLPTAQQAIDTAYNFGLAIVELSAQPRRVYSLPNNSQKSETEALYRIEQLQDLLSPTDVDSVSVEPLRSAVT